MSTEPSANTESTASAGRAPRVSVVIPVYNAMPYLTGTLDSLIAQELTDWEVIAVDDGSSDGSGAEIDRFAAADPRIIALHQPNSGWPGIPRNRGIDRARGEYVFFMDADDTMTPSALREMVELAEQPAGEDPADIVIPRFAGTGGRFVQSLFRRHPAGPISIARAMETLSPQKLFRREFLLRLGLRFPEEPVRLEDGIFVTEAYTRANRILFCGKDPLYLIALREDGQNISSRTIEPENYVTSCRRIAQLLLDGVSDTAAAQKLVLQFFQRKGLRFYVPKRWLPMPAERRAHWVELHRAFLEEFLPKRLDATVAHPTDRRKIELIRAGDVAGLDALIGAEQSFAHDARVAAAERTARGIELRVASLPAHPEELHDGNLPSAGRLRLGRAIDRGLSAFGGNRYARGLSRRVGAGLAHGAPELRLLLSGRRRSRATVLTGRLVRVAPDTGALEYAFVLSPELLSSYGDDRVDLWSVMGNGAGGSGGRFRLRATPGAIRASAAKRVYATREANVSLRPVKGEPR